MKNSAKPLLGLTDTWDIFRVTSSHTTERFGLRTREVPQKTVAQFRPSINTQDYSTFGRYVLYVCRITASQPRGLSDLAGILSPVLPLPYRLESHILTIAI